MLTVARQGFFGSAAAGELGDLNDHAINTGTIWAVSSHLSGSSKLGRELVSDTAATLIGPSTFSAPHPDNPDQLGLDAGNDGGCHATSAAIFANITTTVTMWIDFTLDAAIAWSALFCIRYGATGWPAPYGRLHFLRNSSTASGMWLSFDRSAAGDDASTGSGGVLWGTPGRYQAAVTRAASGDVIFYVNGSSVGSTSMGTGVLDVAGGSLTEPMCLLQRSPDATGEWINGKVHLAQIWNRVLSLSEIQSRSTATGGSERLGTVT